MNIAVLISNAYGYASIVCWVVVLMPQIHLNYKRKSCDGVSLTFYLMWSLGDLLNLAGALLENLILTAILLPLYYILTDGIVLSQFYLYRGNHPRVHDEESALLPASDSEIHSHNHQQLASKKMFIFRTRSLLILACLILLAITFAAHFCSANPEWLAHLDLRKVIAQICGYISAAVYLGAYFPQLLRKLPGSLVPLAQSG
ncbi:PQ loop repeat-domain-containing protein [Coemansia spiralis]|nr:PQ loop repeat-domain-containing protein [Coemansia spiralis]